MDNMLNESSGVVDGYLTSDVVEIADSASGLTVVFAAQLEFNSATQPHQLEEVVRSHLNRCADSGVAVLPTCLRSYGISVEFTRRLQRSVFIAHESFVAADEEPDL